jgi:rubrerythrin
MIRPIQTLEEFLAHAIAIEHEAAERYREFQAHFASRGDDVLAGLCCNLAAIEAAHLARLLTGSRDLDLPAIADHDYRWLEGVSPEAPARELFFRVANKRDLLAVALQGEANAQRFFAWVAHTSPAEAVRSLAREMASDESQHVGWLEQALGYGSASPITA